MHEFYNSEKAIISIFFISRKIYYKMIKIKLKIRVTFVEFSVMIVCVHGTELSNKFIFFFRKIVLFRENSFFDA